MVYTVNPEKQGVMAVLIEILADRSTFLLTISVELPGLKPNHPNQRMMTPKEVKTTEYPGIMGASGIKKREKTSIIFFKIPDFDLRILANSLPMDLETAFCFTFSLGPITRQATKAATPPLK